MNISLQEFVRLHTQQVQLVVDKPYCMFKVKFTLPCYSNSFHGWARCCPTDKFDAATGIEIAQSRAIRKVEKYVLHDPNLFMEFLGWQLSVWRKHYDR